MVVIVMFGFIATGTSILIAQYLGAKQEKEVGKIAAVSIVANLLFGLILSAVLFIFSASLLRAMNLPEELLDTAMIYLKIVGGFAFLQG